MEHRLTVLQLVLASLRDQPQTVEELCDGLKRGRESVNTALRVLRRDGAVENSGMNRLTASGRPAVVWRASDGPAPDAQAERLGILPALRWRCK